MRLTVVVPTYNRAELLARTLRGLLDQTAAPETYEIVVVDDGSTDHTTSVVRDMDVSPKERLRYLRQDNKGPAAARNLGVRESSGEVVLFTGDDCLPDRRLIEEHLRSHHRDGDVGVVGHATWHPEINITPLMAFLEEGAQFGFRKIEDAENVPVWFFYTANCSVQRHWIEEVGGFDEEFRYAAYEDVELAYRMQAKGLRIVYRPAARTYHYHATALEEHLRRQMLCGRSAVLLWRKHPELKEALGIVHSGRASTALKLYEAASEYSFALGVRDELKRGDAAPEDETRALGSDLQLAQAGQAWVREIFGAMGPSEWELVKLRAELHRLTQALERITSRRLYRWSEKVARAGWWVFRKLGFGRRVGVE